VAGGLLISIKSLFKGPERPARVNLRSIPALHHASTPNVGVEESACHGSTVLRRDYREKTEWLSNFC
jgi:hypothetical protein